MKRLLAILALLFAAMPASAVGPIIWGTGTNALNLQSYLTSGAADATHAGLVSTTSQTIAGDKTLTGSLTAGTTSADQTHLFQSGGATTVKLGTAAASGVSLELNRTVNTASRWQAYLPASSTDWRFWNSVNSDVFTITQAGRGSFLGGLLGRTDASTATAGNIGEVLRSDSSSSASMTSLVTPANIITLSITAGDWLIFGSTPYVINAVVSGGGAAPYAAYAQFDLRNTTDSTTIAVTQGGSACSTNADCSKSHLASVYLMGKTSVSGTKTIALRALIVGAALGSASAANSGSITWNNFSLTNAVQLYAVRVD